MYFLPPLSTALTGWRMTKNEWRAWRNHQQNAKYKQAKKNGTTPTTKAKVKLKGNWRPTTVAIYLFIILQRFILPWHSTTCFQVNKEGRSKPRPFCITLQVVPKLLQNICVYMYLMRYFRYLQFITSFIRGYKHVPILHTGMNNELGTKLRYHVQAKKFPMSQNLFPVYCLSWCACTL